MILSECKFSFESLKRKHVNQMIGTLNKLNPTPYKSYIVLFDTKVKLNAKLEEIQENTSSPNFNNMMKKFNLITIENFDDGNPFLELN